MKSQDAPKTPPVSKDLTRLLFAGDPLRRIAPGILVLSSGVRVIYLRVESHAKDLDDLIAWEKSDRRTFKAQNGTDGTLYVMPKGDD